MKKKNILQLFIFPIIFFLISWGFKCIYFYVLHFIFLIFGFIVLAVAFIVIAVEYYDLFKKKKNQ